MESLDYWRMCDDLSVMQCILLILGVDPKRLQDTVERDIAKRPDGYEAVGTAVKHAILHKKLRANVCVTAYQLGWVKQPHSPIIAGHDANGTLIFYETEPNWHRTTVAVDDLRIWLQSRNMRPEFFFPPKSDLQPFLDSRHEKYAPKLAAAVEAWQAVANNDSLTTTRSPKGALMAWLKKHGSRFGLKNTDGTPNRQAIQDIAKVANWDLKGGAPKTLGEPTHPSKPL